MLTNNGSLFGKKLLNELVMRSIRVDAAVVVNQPLVYHRKLFRYVEKRVGFINAIYFALRRVFFSEKTPSTWKGKIFMRAYEGMGIPIVYTKGSNSDQTIRVLKDLKPDLLLLGQTGIVGSSVLEIPRTGTLNAHPGILPDYRGIDCAKWALYRNDFENIGCSVHWVDTGVDTGPIITRETYRICCDETLDTLEANLDDLAITMLAEVVMWILNGKEPDIFVQDKMNGNQYYKMSLEKERIVRKTLSEQARSSGI